VIGETALVSVPDIVEQFVPMCNGVIKGEVQTVFTAPPVFPFIVDGEVGATVGLQSAAVVLTIFNHQIPVDKADGLWRGERRA
jgi:hypothetical protein